MTFPNLTLSKVASVRMGSPAPQGTEFFSADGKPFVRVQDVGRAGRTLSLTETKDRINDHAIRTHRPVFAKKGTIVFPKSGAAIATNSRAILCIDAYVVSHLAVIEAFPEMIETEWLYFYLCTIDMVGLSRTTSLPSLRLSELGEVPVPVPPLPEQRRIVARIKECMDRVEEIETNATKVARELDALFPALLNERYAAIRDAHGARLLEDVADIRGGSSLPEGTAIDEGAASVLLVKVGDMNADGNERTINVAREFLPMAKAGRGTIAAGAVIFPKRGGAIATNKKRLLGRPALLDPNLMAVVAKRELLRPDYLYYWCLALDLSKLSNGGVIPQLNRKDLAPLELPIPGITDQGQIVEELQQAEQHCSQLKVEFKGAQADRASLREAILRKAFAGDL